MSSFGGCAGGYAASTPTKRKIRGGRNGPHTPNEKLFRQPLSFLLGCTQKAIFACSIWHPSTLLLPGAVSKGKGTAQGRRARDERQRRFSPREAKNDRHK